MGEGDLMRMQKHAFKGNSSLFRFLQHPIEGKVAVFIVTDNCKTTGRQVYPDLMGATGLELSFEQRELAETPQQGKYRVRGQPICLHPYPTFVYVLEGAIEVETASGMIHSYKAGDSFLMVVNTWTNAKNTGTMPAKVLVVYVGVHGKPNLVRPH